MPDLVDIGANLTHDSFDRDRDQVLRRARDVGVRRLIVTGTSLDASRQALELARQFPGQLFSTTGIHPHHASDFGPDDVSELSELASAPEVRAVGECGLDFFRDFSPRDVQLETFEAQLMIAKTIQKPVFLHQRDAHDPFTALLREHLPDIPGGVAHCFTGNKIELREYLAMGLYIGITGWICDERRSHDLREAVKYLPLDRIVLETDAPYLLPRNIKDQPSGRRNEPSLLPHILDTVAHYMEQPTDRVAEAATRNTERLFELTARTM